MAVARSLSMSGDWRCRYGMRVGRLDDCPGGNTGVTGYAALVLYAVAMATLPCYNNMVSNPSTLHSTFPLFMSPIKQVNLHVYLHAHFHDHFTCVSVRPEPKAHSNGEDKFPRMTSRANGAQGESVFQNPVWTCEL